MIIRSLPHQFSSMLADLASVQGLRGGLWMLAAATCFAMMINLVRLASLTQHTLEIAFFRSLFGLIAMLPWLISVGRQGLQTNHMTLHLMRASTAFISMCMWFYTLSVLPLAEATAISFTAPIFAMVLASVLLGEAMFRARWIAMALAVIGGLIIVQPGARAFDPVAIIAIVTSLMWGGGTILVKLLARHDSAATIVSMQGILIVPVSLIPALFVWRTPTWFEFCVMAGTGLFGSLAHYCMGRAMKTADAGFLAVFDYMRLPLVAVFAFFLFDEVPAPAVLLGAVMIAGGALYSSRHEHVRNVAGRAG